MAPRGRTPLQPRAGGSNIGGSEPVSRRLPVEPDLGAGVGQEPPQAFWLFCADDRVPSARRHENRLLPELRHGLRY